jgi:hypothetical protein
VRMVILATVVMLALAGALFIRARILTTKSIVRDGLSRFRDSIHGRYPESLLAQTYRYLAERHGAVGPHHIVNPEDELDRVFGLVDLDLEDAVLVIADRAGARLPRSADLDELKSRGVRTVDDLMRFLEPYFVSEPVKG